MKIMDPKEFGVALAEGSITVDGKKIMDGDTIVIKDKDGAVVESDIVKFCIHDDEESSFWHLGVLVRWRSGRYATLAEAFLWIKGDELEWTVVRER